jgi:hypothetical protein
MGRLLESSGVRVGGSYVMNENRTYKRTKATSTMSTADSSPPKLVGPPLSMLIGEVDNDPLRFTLACNILTTVTEYSHYRYGQAMSIKEEVETLILSSKSKVIRNNDSALAEMLSVELRRSANRESRQEVSTRRKASSISNIIALTCALIIDIVRTALRISDVERTHKWTS